MSWKTKTYDDGREWTADDLEVSSEEEEVQAPQPRAQPRVATPPPPQPPARRSIPGPAGYLVGDGHASQAVQRQDGAPGRGVRFFQSSTAWRELTERLTEDQAALRMTIVNVVRAASVPPPIPVRVKVMCGMVKELGETSDAGDDVRVILEDETGEMDGTIDRRVFDKFPGLVKVGSACALLNTPVLSLSATRHHLILHPLSVAHVVAPVPP
jgi:hypothetical protein